MGAIWARFAAVILAAGLVLATADVSQADKLTEQNMTQKDFDEITKIDTTGPGQANVKPLGPIHDLNDAELQTMKAAHGVKLIKGKQWKKMSPAERGKAIRDLSSKIGKDTALVIEVPSGNVWSLDAARYVQMDQGKSIRPWHESERQALPKAVKADPVLKQEDRRNDSTVRIGTAFKF